MLSSLVGILRPVDTHYIPNYKLKTTLLVFGVPEETEFTERFNTNLTYLKNLLKNAQTN